MIKVIYYCIVSIIIKILLNFYLNTKNILLFYLYSRFKLLLLKVFVDFWLTFIFY